MGADAKRPPSDMNGAGDEYRHSEARKMHDIQDEDVRRDGDNKKHVQHSKNVPGASSGDNQQSPYSSDEGHDSDFSSRSTSEDYELDHLTAGDPFSDDAETGSRKKDKPRRKRRRRQGARMDERFTGSVKAPKIDPNFANREICKAWLINTLLVLSWYTFSLSISIVSKASVLPGLHHLLTIS